MFNTRIRTQTLLLLLSLTGAASLFFTACKKDNETAQENLTTLEVHLVGAGFDHTYYWSDPDGPGGTDPTVDTITLPANTSGIQCELRVLDRSVTPEDDLTDEIKAENTAHVFLYSINDVTGLLISNLSTDANGNRFGQTSTWETTVPSTGGNVTGSLNIRLFHEPTDKNNSVDPGGEVDIDVSFPLRVQ